MTESYPDDYLLPDYPLDYPDPAYWHTKTEIQKILYPILLVLAVLGAVPCIIILFKFSYSVWSTSLYLAILIFCDILLLFMHCGGAWYFAMYRISITTELLSMSDAVCKVLSFVMNFVRHMSSWSMTAAAIELVIMVRFPAKLYKMCTREKANSVVLLMTVLLTFINLHYFWTWEVTQPGDMTGVEYPIDQPLCHMNKLDKGSEEFTTNVAPVIDFCVKYLIPVLVTTICVFIIILTKLEKPGHHPKEDSDSLLGKYFMDTSAMQEMQLVTFVICVWFAIAEGYALIIDLLYKFINFDHIDYLILDSLQFCKNLLDFLFYSLKPWIFFLLSRRVRQSIDGAFRWVLTGCQKARNYRVSKEQFRQQKRIRRSQEV